MKKSISVWSFRGNMSILQCMRMAKEAGFDGIELALNETGPLSLESTPEELAQIKAQAAGIGVELPSLATGLYWSYSLSSDDPMVREKALQIVKAQIDAAKAIGAKNILVVAGHVGVDFAPDLGQVDYDTAYGRIAEAFQTIRLWAEAAQIGVCVENVGNRLLMSPLEFRNFLDDVGSQWVGAYFDVGNVLYNSGYPQQWIKILNTRIRAVHFKDFRCAGREFVDLLAGDVDYPAVMAAFKEIGYEGWVTGEMIPNYKHHTNQIIYNTSASMDVILGRRTVE